MFCNHCGKALNENDICSDPFCPANTNKNEEKFTYSNFSSDLEIKEFIGNKNTYYYLDKWSTFKEDNNFKSWNWPAFFLGPWWFWYRKMYMPTLAIFATYSIIKCLDSSLLSLILKLAISICSGIFGNQIYLRFADKKINSIKSSQSLSSDIVLNKIRSKGGVTKAPIIVAIISLFILTIVITALFTLLIDYI